MPMETEVEEGGSENKQLEQTAEAWRCRLLYGSGYIAASRQMSAPSRKKPKQGSAEVVEATLSTPHLQASSPSQSKLPPNAVVITRRYHHLAPFIGKSSTVAPVVVSDVLDRGDPASSSAQALMLNAAMRSSEGDLADETTNLSALLDKLLGIPPSPTRKKVFGASERLLRNLAKPKLPELHPKVVLSSEQLAELNSRLYYGSLTKDKAWAEKTTAELLKSTAAGSTGKLDAGKAQELQQRLFYFAQEQQRASNAKLMQKYCPAPPPHRLTVDEERSSVQRLYDERIENFRKRDEKLRIKHIPELMKRM